MTEGIAVEVRKLALWIKISNISVEKKNEQLILIAILFDVHQFSV